MLHPDDAKMLDRFERLARVYRLVTPFMFRTWNRMSALAELKAGDFALDVAGGAGNLAARLVRQTPAVTVVDLSPAMLSRAGKRLRGTGVVLTQADAKALPFPDRAFDISFVSMALHEVPATDAVAILREMRRVTRRSIIAADFAVPRTRAGLWVLKQTIGRGEEANFFDFLKIGLPELVDRAGLTVLSTEQLWLAGTEILVAQPGRRETTARAATAEQ